MDPDPSWIRIEELCGSVFRIRIRVHTVKNRVKIDSKGVRLTKKCRDLTLQLFSFSFFNPRPLQYVIFNENCFHLKLFTFFSKLVVGGKKPVPLPRSKIPTPVKERLRIIIPFNKKNTVRYDAIAHFCAFSNSYLDPYLNVPFLSFFFFLSLKFVKTKENSHK